MILLLVVVLKQTCLMGHVCAVRCVLRTGRRFELENVCLVLQSMNVAVRGVGDDDLCIAREKLYIKKRTNRN